MKRFAALVLLAALIGKAHAFDPFVIGDIRIDGLARISPGTVFTYLPIEKGDRLDQARAAEAVRALYRTGFFRDVKMARQGEILVIEVIERPAISKIEIDGNRDIKDEDLLRVLREVGLSEGETFDRLDLERLTQELIRQYNNRGKYNVSVKPTITDIDRNRVEIKIDIVEGKTAQISYINIVNNQAFTEDDLREEWELDSTNWLSWYSRDNQYSREKLSGDLERLQSFYQDRGYVDFDIESTQVTINPDRRNIFLSAGIREGEIYTLSELKLSGDLILDEADLRRLIISKPGETFSRRKLEATSEAITQVLGNIGYAFAEVTPVPEIDKAERTVAVNFFVNPGKRVYVRRVSFEGNTATEDQVLRREMRQLEGAWFSQAAIDRSKIRLQRLGFFTEVDIDTPRVPGSDDQIDVVVNVKEQSAGAVQVGLGYSAIQGVVTNLSVQQRNLLGTGNSIGLGVQNNAFQRQFDFNWFDPYFTDDGVSLGYNLRYSELDQGNANIANFSTDTSSGSVIMGIPLTETDTVSMQLGIDRNRITTTDGATPGVLIDYLVGNLGDRARFPCLDVPDEAGVLPVNCIELGPFRQWTVNSWTLEAFWARDSRNRFFAPTRGSFQRVGATVSLPGSDLEYYKIFYRGGRYFPINSWMTLLGLVDLGYGDGYGDTAGLPFYENFYAGGVQAGVRGFQDNTLGPCDDSGIFSDFCQPLGGAFRTVGTLELIFPTPFAKRGQDSTQVSAFLDVGNVFSNFDSFDTGELRASAGVSFKWQAPVGPIIVNFARPLRKQDGDRTENIQFTFGSQF